MANKASDQIWQLIKNMNRTEKRYFKVGASHNAVNEGKDFITLFSDIDQQEEYDEKALLQRFSGRAFVRNFSLTKNRLYSAILKHLESYRAASSAEVIIQRQVNSARLLFEKSLFSQSLKILSNAKRIARQYEMFSQLLEISKLEKSIFEKQNYDGIGRIELAAFEKENKALLNELTTSNELWNFKTNIFLSLYAQGKVRSQPEVKKFESLLNSLNLKMSKRSLSVTNTYMLNHVNSAHYFNVGRYDLCLPFLEKNLELAENKSLILGNHAANVVSTLTNAIAVANKLDLKQKVKEMMNKIEQLKPVLYAEKDWLHYFMATSTQFTLLVQQGEFEKAVQLVPDIAEKLKEAENEISPIRKAQMHFNIVLAFIGTKDFKSALRWNNELINTEGVDHNLDIFCMSQLIRLVIHYELGNIELMHFILRSVQRYLETRHRVYRFETIFLAFINEILKRRKSKPGKDLFSGLVEDLESIPADHHEQVVFEYFDFIGWAKEKTSEFVLPEVA